MGNSAEAWHELFVATAGADAALAGLVFVAVSINLDRILHLDGVPERALQTLTLLVGVVLVSFLGLTPQSSTALGIEIVVLGAALLALFARTLRATVRSVLGKPSWVLPRGPARARQRSLRHRRDQPARANRRRTVLGAGRDDRSDAGRRVQRLGPPRGDSPLST